MISTKIAIQLPSVITMSITDISEELANIILSYLDPMWTYMSVALVCSKFHLWTKYHKKVVLTTSHEFAVALRQLEEKKKRLEHALLRGDCLKCYDHPLLRGGCLKYYDHSQHCSDEMIISCKYCVNVWYGSINHCSCEYKDCAKCGQSVCQKFRVECDMCGNCFCNLGMVDVHHHDDCIDCASHCANGDLGLCKRIAKIKYRTSRKWNLRVWSHTTPYVCTLCVARHGPLCSMCSVGNIVTPEYIAELKRKREVESTEPSTYIKRIVKRNMRDCMVHTEPSTWTQTLQKFQAKKQDEAAMAKFLEQEKQLLREEESHARCVVYPVQTMRRNYGGQRKRLSRGARRKLERMLM